MNILCGTLDYVSP